MNGRTSDVILLFCKLATPCILLLLQTLLTPGILKSIVPTRWALTHFLQCNNKRGRRDIKMGMNIMK